MENEIKALFDEYDAGRVNRREFIQRITAMASLSAIAGLTANMAQAQPLRPDWQDALVEGIVNYREGHPEPFSSGEHRNWLFNSTNGLYGTPVEAARAIGRVRTPPIDVDPNDVAPIQGVMSRINQLGGIGAPNGGGQILYDQMRKKIDHAMFHMAEAIYKGEATTQECKDFVVEYGTKVYFQATNDTLKNTFRRMLDGHHENLEEESHDW